MTPKERMKAAFDFKQQDDLVPFWELEFQIYPEMFGKDLITGHAFAKLSAKEKERAMHYNAELLVEVAEKLGYCAIRQITGYWEVEPGVGASYWLPDTESQVRQVEILSRLAGDRYMIIGDAPGLIGIPPGNEVMRFVDDMYERPGELKEQAEKMLQWGIAYGRMMAGAGAECLLNCTDIAFNQGTFMSPAQIDEFFTPYFYRLIETLKKEGVYMMFHSDGNLMPVIDMLADSGLNALQCIDPLGGMDIVALKNRMEGKLCLVGNIDCSILQLGTKEQIDENVRHVLENCKFSGGFVLSACNIIFKDIPPENYQVMVDAHKKYGSLARMETPL